MINVTATIVTQDIIDRIRREGWRVTRRRDGQFTLSQAGTKITMTPAEVIAFAGIDQED